MILQRKHIGAVLLAGALGIPAAQAQTVVGGQSDLWLAGMPDGSTASAGDVAPDQSPVQVLGVAFSAGDALSFSATGCVHHTPDINLCNGPDGGGPFAHQGAINNISNLVTNLNAVIGVFLTDSIPTAMPAPATLSFTGNDVDYLTIAPELQQSFFIGDGLTSTGVTQQVIVPADATRLFLGTHDGFGWFNNVGEHVVTVTVTPGVDSDSDGVVDAVDNCVLSANPDQTDSNADGYGNACDADLNDDCIVNATDLGLLRTVFFTADADADFTGDGIVNASDLGVMRATFFTPPGPSGLTTTCD